MSSSAQDTADVAVEQALKQAALAKPAESADRDVDGLDELDAEANGHAEEAAVVPEPEAAAVKLYFVRMPRPPLDDTLLKRLQGEFQSHVAEIKTINGRLAAKREVVRELRKQMSQARSLKDTSQPEFEEKLNRLKQLRELRNGYQNKVSAIKGNVKGLECRTEAELDAKIRQEEDKIRYGGIALREEKQVVNEISKLRAQRDKIKDYELQKSSLGELESEVSKVKAVIDEMEGEFSIIKGERDAASKIMGDFYTQLKAAEKEAEKVEEEQKEAVEKKNESLEALEAARREVDSSMVEYRDNRKFSLQVRDMVAAGQIEDAQQLCASQVNELMAKLSSDVPFRSEYNKIWADQRRFAVSELLPESSTAAMAAAATRAPVKAGAKGAKGEPAPKLVPRGAEKAKDLIASLMQQASAEAARIKSSAPVHYDEDEEQPERELEAAEAAPKAAPAVPAKPTAPPKHVENPAAKAAEVFNFKVDVPVIDTTEFVAPVIRTETEAVSKDQVREEQRLKAKEAEERKKKRAEQTDKKRTRAVELQKKADEEEKVIKAQQHSRAAEPEPESEPEAAAPAKEAAPVTSKPALPAAALKAPASANKRPAGKASLLKKLKKFYQQNQTSIVVVAVILLMLFIILAASLY